VSAAAFIALALVVHGRPPLPLDVLVDRWFVVRGRGMRRLLEAMSALASWWALFVVAIAAAVVARRGLPGRPLRMPLIIAGGIPVELLVKWLVNRARPHSGVVPSTYAFPSGHVFAAVVAFGALAYALARAPSTGLRTRALGVTLCALAVTAVAVGRLCLHRHWISDVIGGFTGAVAYLAAALALLERGRVGRAGGGVLP